MFIGHASWYSQGGIFSLSTCKSRTGLDAACDPFLAPMRRENSSSKRNRTLKTDKYTLIMPAFRRNDLLSTVLRHYCNFSGVDKIILVWNNVNEDPPSPNMSRHLHCTRNIIILAQRVNLITNRFLPVEHINTEGKCVSHMTHQTVNSYHCGKYSVLACVIRESICLDMGILYNAHHLCGALHGC